METNKNASTERSIERLALNKAEAREALGGISAVTIWRLERRGLIQAIPGLRHKLYSVESLKRFVAGKATA
jgi:hypothetical protein